MKEIFILLVVATVSCSAIVCQLDQMCESPTIEAGQVDSYAMEVRQKMATHRCFRETLESTLQALEHDEISLADAASRVRDASQAWWPIYLADTDRLESGWTPTERIARNLIGHLENRVEFNPDLNSRVQALRLELHSIDWQPAQK
ncbi:MAG TPA: hypothetical protein VFE62_23560 [Gemmataceae bacterium]|nr:hypothetical protein [Gemmataceae bacterium]